MLLTASLEACTVDLRRTAVDCVPHRRNLVAGQVRDRSTGQEDTGAVRWKVLIQTVNYRGKQEYKGNRCAR